MITITKRYFTLFFIILIYFRVMRGVLGCRMKDYLNEIIMHVNDSDVRVLIERLLEEDIISLEELNSKILEGNYSGKILSMYLIYIGCSFLDKRDIIKIMEQLTDKIVSSMDAKQIYEFAQYACYKLPRTMIDKLADAILATNNIEYIFLFMLNVKDYSNSKVVAAIDALRGNPKKIYDLIVKKDIYQEEAMGKAIDALVECKDAKYLFDIAKYIERKQKVLPGGLWGYKDKLVDGLIASQNYEYIREFAMDTCLELVYVEKLALSLINIEGLTDKERAEKITIFTEVFNFSPEALNILYNAFLYYDREEHENIYYFARTAKGLTSGMLDHLIDIAISKGDACRICSIIYSRSDLTPEMLDKMVKAVITLHGEQELIERIKYMTEICISKENEFKIRIIIKTLLATNNLELANKIRSRYLPFDEVYFSTLNDDEKFSCLLWKIEKCGADAIAENMDVFKRVLKKGK